MVIEWNKNKIFASSAEWNKALNSLNQDIELYKSRQDIFLNSLSNFKKFTELKIKVDKSIEEIYCYPRRYLDIDNTSEEHKLMFNKALDAYKRIVDITNIYETLINSNKDKVLKYLEDDSLKYYQRYYDIILASSQHVNDKESEYFKTYQSIRDEYQTLISNMEYQNITIDDESIKVDANNYQKLIDSENPETRKVIYNAYLDSYKNIGVKLFILYIDKLKNDIKNAKNKKYNSLKEMKLLEIELPDGLIDKTISSVNKHLNIIHEYGKLKKELANLEEFHLYDSSIRDNEEASSDIEYPKAFKLVKDSLSILGKEYSDYVEEIYNGGSIDLLPKKNKKTISSTGITYAGIPYICLNYRGTLTDVKTIAHEIGHAVHVLFSKNNNKFEYFEFSLFITEVVAKVNECIFYHYFLERCQSEEEKKKVLGNYISQLIDSLFSQIMYTEFEDYIVSTLSNNENISIDDVNNKYEELLVKYNGDSLSLSDRDKYGWMRVSHFVLQEPYYLYQYSIGTALANIIYYKIINENNFINKYIEFLKLGNKVNIIDSLKTLDINLLDENIFDYSFSLLNDLVEGYKDLCR